MPKQSRQAFTYQKAAELFDNAYYPTGTITPENAWISTYQVILWYEPVDYAGYTTLPHIIDADKLRPSAYKRAAMKQGDVKNVRVWMRRARAVEKYLADKLGVEPSDVEGMVDKLLKF